MTKQQRCGFACFERFTGEPNFPGRMHNSHRIHGERGRLSMRLQIAFLIPKLSKAQQEIILERKLKQLQKEQSPALEPPTAPQN
jgi:hypothetical protein